MSDSSLIFSEVFGVLVLESTEKEAFEKSKISLLQELADDLTYGITSLQTRQARRESEEKEEGRWGRKGGKKRKASDKQKEKKIKYKKRKEHG